MSAPVDPLSAVPKPFFLLGRIVATPSALHLMQRTDTAPESLLMRHVSGDWGEICAEDAEQNQIAIQQGYRLLSAYRLPLQERALAGGPYVKYDRFRDRPRTARSPAGAFGSLRKPTAAAQHSFYRKNIDAPPSNGSGSFASSLGRCESLRRLCSGHQHAPGICLGSASLQSLGRQTSM